MSKRLRENAEKTKKYAILGGSRKRIREYHKILRKSPSRPNAARPAVRKLNFTITKSAKKNGRQAVFVFFYDVSRCHASF